MTQRRNHVQKVKLLRVVLSPERSPSFEEWMWQLDPAFTVALPWSLPLWCWQTASMNKPETPFVNPVSIYSMRYTWTRTPTAQDRVCLWDTNLLWAPQRPPPFRKGDGGQGYLPPWGGLQAQRPQEVLCATLSSLQEDQAAAHLSRQRFM